MQSMLGINEKYLFYSRLRKFYKLKLISNVPNIIDVGSNKGQSIDFFLSLNSQSFIFGFEPNLKLFNKLKNKYQENARIELQNIGVSSKIGTLRFFENVMDETSTFEILNENSVYLKRKARILGVTTNTIIADSYDVNVTTLKSFIENHPNTFFDVLKIDVEGHEFECLKGLFDDKKKTYPIKFIQLESHNDDMYVNSNNTEKLIEMLIENGFSQIAKFKHGFGDFFEIVFENNKL